jgi:hypothetical protein
MAGIAAGLGAAVLGHLPPELCPRRVLGRVPNLDLCGVEWGGGPLHTGTPETCLTSEPVLRIPKMRIGRMRLPPNATSDARSLKEHPVGGGGRPCAPRERRQERAGMQLEAAGGRVSPRLPRAPAGD